MWLPWFLDFRSCWRIVFLLLSLSFLWLRLRLFLFLSLFLLLLLLSGSSLFRSTGYWWCIIFFVFSPTFRCRTGIFSIGFEIYTAVFRRSFSSSWC